MKQATCSKLGGACEEMVMGATAEEMGENSRNHCMNMMQSGDKDHQDAMNAMMAMTPEDQQKWYQDFIASFDTLDEV